MELDVTKWKTTKNQKRISEIPAMNNHAQSKLLLRCYAQLFSCYTWLDLAHLAPG